MHANFDSVYCLLVLEVELKARGIFSVLCVKCGEVFVLGSSAFGLRFVPTRYRRLSSNP